MKLLIVVDMQHDFVNGSLGSTQAQAIVPKVKAKIDEYNRQGHIIIFTRDTHGKNYLETQEGKLLPVEHCIHGTDGWKIYDGLDDGCTVYEYIDKPTFGWRNWEDTLNKVNDEINEIELVGLCTDICVVSNALILKCLYSETKITVDAFAVPV
jgi:nicotinamidase-related amidase